MATPRGKIPEAAIRRLPVYLRELADMHRAGVTVTSSADLAERTGFTSEQIRKDLAYFGAFGTRGVGYDTKGLADAIRKILRLRTLVPVAMIGAGNLGLAFTRYSRQQHKDVRITAVFDVDPQKVGQMVMDLRIQSMNDLERVIAAQGTKLAVLAVPSEVAQIIVDRLAASGIEAILNFTPVKLKVDHVHIQDIDITMELMSLAYFTSEIQPDPQRFGEGF